MKQTILFAMLGLALLSTACGQASSESELQNVSAVNQVTFKLDQAVTINPGNKKTINLGKVNRPGYVLMNIRSNFNLSTSNVDAISLKIIQTTKSKTLYTLPVLPKIAPYVKSGETIKVRNFDGVGNNPGDETMENILIEVMNKSLSPVTLNMADVIVNIRAD